MNLAQSLRKALQSIWSYRFVRILIGLVFILSGFSKITKPQSFAVIIDAYGLVPSGLTIIVAVFLIIVELLAGFALLLDLKGGLTTISLLLVVFMSILGYGIWMGLDVDCGCFGPEDIEAEAFHGLRSALYRDFLILAGIVYLYWWRYRLPFEHNHPSRLIKQIQFWRDR